MSSRKWQRRIEDILDAIAEIQSFSAVASSLCTASFAVSFLLSFAIASSSGIRLQADAAAG